MDESVQVPKSVLSYDFFQLGRIHTDIHETLDVLALDFFPGKVLLEFLVLHLEVGQVLIDQLFLFDCLIEQIYFFLHTAKPQLVAVRLEPMDPLLDELICPFKLRVEFGRPLGQYSQDGRVVELEVTRVDLFLAELLHLCGHFLADCHVLDLGLFEGDQLRSGGAV